MLSVLGEATQQYSLNEMTIFCWQQVPCTLHQTSIMEGERR